jgi:SNF2 family DNA or RNA helicase
VNADRKICLTGTPFVNHPRDIQALLEFLQVDPLSDKKTFESAITNPILAMKSVGLVRIRAATSCFAFRRTKDILDKEKVIDIPKKTVRVQAVPFEEGSIHKSVHDVLYEVSRMILLELFQNRSKVSSSFSFLMVLLLRVRQSCCHACLVPYQCREGAKALYRNLEEGGIFDSDEAQQVLAKLVRSKDANVVDGGVDKLIDVDSDMKTSPKVEALLKYIQEEMAPDEKGVIFSQWTSHLKYIEEALDNNGHHYAKIDGSMNTEERTQVRCTFICLSSLKRYDKSSHYTTFYLRDSPCAVSNLKDAIPSSNPGSSFAP